MKKQTISQTKISCQQRQVIKLLWVAIWLLSITTLPVMAQWGNGSAGAKIFTETNSTDDIRTYAEFTSPGNCVTVSNPAGFLVGDMALIIDMNDCENNQQNWELQTIVDVTPTTICFVNPIIAGFSSGQLIKVPQYTDVTIGASAVLTCNPWDGSTGGVAVIMANGTLTFEGSGLSVGKIDVSGKGYLPGLAGAGGTGGVGGLGGAPGQTGKLTGNAGQGIAGAGWGAKKGSSGGLGIQEPTPEGCGSGIPAVISAENISKGTLKWILPGGGGAGGAGGNGGSGAGGAGGDSQICEPDIPAGSGGNGGDGGNGGVGADGGAGAGLIIIVARKIMPEPLSDKPLIAKGANGSNAPLTSATQGGLGGEANEGMGAGGGDGADGGNGGSGGNGGAGGSIWIKASNWSSLLVSPDHRDVAGGIGGSGRNGGLEGGKGENADLSALLCPISIPIIPVGPNHYFCACDEVWERLCNTTPGTSVDVEDDLNNVIGTKNTFTKSNIVCEVITYGTANPNTQGSLSVVCTDNSTSPESIYYCDMLQVPPAETDNPYDLLNDLAIGYCSFSADQYNKCKLFADPTGNLPEYNAPCCGPVPPSQERIEPVNGLDGSSGSPGQPGGDGDDGGEDGPDCSITVPLDFQKLCETGPNSTIEITASGGNGPYTWTQDDGSGSGPQTLTETGATISTTAPPNGPGRYCVMDAEGCETCIDIVDPDPIPVITPPGPITIGQEGSVELDAGAGFATYSWTFDGDLIPNANEQILTATEEGIYCVTVADEYTCEGSDCVEVIIMTIDPYECPEDLLICCTQEDYLLTNSFPSGGVFIGPHVISSGVDYYFDPECDDLGNFEISYYYPDENAPLFSCTFTVTVEGVLNPDCPPLDTIVCISTEAFWNGTIFIDPAALGLGTHYFSCFSINSCGVIYELSMPPSPSRMKVTVLAEGEYPIPDITVCRGDLPLTHWGIEIPVYNYGTTNPIPYYDYTDPCGNEHNGLFNVHVLGVDYFCNTQYIDCSTDWELYSAYVNPNPPGPIPGPDPFPDDIATIFEPVTDLGQLSVLLSTNGIYWPSGSINTIGNWDVYQGYKIKMNEPGWIEIKGVIPEDKTITLNPGANYIPVLSAEYYPAGDIFAQLGSALIFAYDLGSELLYWPQGGIYMLDVLEPGKGYLVGMTQPGQATYDPLLKSDVKNYVPVKPKVYVNAPWEITKSGSPHLISIDRLALVEFEPGDFIGVFNVEGMCAGMSQIDKSESNLLLVAYGNDFTEKTAKGLADGETMQFRVYRASTMDETHLAMTFDASMPNMGLFTENGLSKIMKIKTGATSVAEDVLSDIQIYPNPSNGTFTIMGIEQSVTVRIYNLLGDQVYFGKLDLPSKLDLSSHSKGVYFIRIKNDQHMQFQKLILK